MCLRLEDLSRRQVIVLMPNPILEPGIARHWPEVREPRSLLTRGREHVRIAACGSCDLRSALCDRATFEATNHLRCDLPIDGGGSAVGIGDGPPTPELAERPKRKKTNVAEGARPGNWDFLRLVRRLVRQPAHVEAAIDADELCHRRTRDDEEGLKHTAVPSNQQPERMNPASNFRQRQKSLGG